LLPKPHRSGRKQAVPRRALLNAAFYVARTGCQWRQLPHDFPPWGTVASQFHRWRAAGVAIEEELTTLGKTVLVLQ
jgi:putative transposase